MVNIYNQYDVINEDTLENASWLKEIAAERDGLYLLDEYCGTIKNEDTEVTIMPAYNVDLQNMVEYLKNKKCKFLDLNNDWKHTKYPQIFKVSAVFESYARCVLCGESLEFIKSIDSCPKIEEKKVFEKGICYIQDKEKPNLKPDIVIKNGEENIVMDVKFKDGLKKHNIREDRLQILTYALMWSCKTVGHIFPASNSKLSIRISEINKVGDGGGYYVQVFLPTGQGCDTNWRKKVFEYISNPEQNNGADFQEA